MGVQIRKGYEGLGVAGAMLVVAMMLIGAAKLIPGVSISAEEGDSVMAKVGQIVTIPTGSCCNITLDSGEEIIVNHKPGVHGDSVGARFTVDRLKLGFCSGVRRSPTSSRGAGNSSREGDATG